VFPPEKQDKEDYPGPPCSGLCGRMVASLLNYSSAPKWNMQDQFTENTRFNSQNDSIWYQPVKRIHFLTVLCYTLYKTPL